MSNPNHWLMFNEGREVVGCHCGFPAADEDEGYGDSVVDHLLVVELIDYRAAVKEGAKWWTVNHSINVTHFLHDLDDWIKSVHDWPVRRFNPLRVPHAITHSPADHYREAWKP